jgi:hypothetical protein
MYQQNKTKAMWQIINKEVGRAVKHDNKIELHVGSKIISDPQAGADMLNKHFVEVINELVNRSSRKNGNTAQVQTQRINFCPKTVFLCPVTEDEIEWLTKSLKGKPSAGYHEIPKYVVKQCIKYIKKPLVHIYNASLWSGTFPDRLKIAKVIPLHKNGSIHDAKKYRPISVLPVLSKILEKLMCNRLIPFLVESNVITDAQNGFRRKKSTNTACQTFIENMQEALDKGLHAIGMDTL